MAFAPDGSTLVAEVVEVVDDRINVFLGRWAVPNDKGVPAFLPTLRVP